MTGKRKSVAATSRARSTSKRRPDARDRLIEASIQVFSESGFHAAKISDIVARAGYTQPTFYMHFSSKDQIYQHLMERVRSELREVIASARIPADVPHEDVREKLKGAIKAFLQYFIDNPRLAPLGYFDVDHNAGLREEIVALVSRNVAFEQGAGYCRTDIDPVFLSECYNGSLERLIRVYLLRGELDAVELADKIADLYGFGTIPDSVRNGA